MPQTFQVLRCYKCAVFQVHPTKKSNKWTCKLCNEKQSHKRFYGIGTGKECRVYIQKLNGIKGDIDNAKCESEDSDQFDDTDISENSLTVHQACTKKSKWTDYLDANDDDETDTCPNETEIITERPAKQPRKTVMKSKETNSFLYKRGSISNISNTNIIESVEPTLCQYNNVPLNTQTETYACNNSKISVINQSVQNSKWTQFVEDPPSCNDEHFIPSRSNSDNELKPPISLFDEEDNLDAVLEL